MRCARLAVHIPAYLEGGGSSLGSGSSAQHRGLAPLAREDFISKKLSPKLAQQLKAGRSSCWLPAPPAV